MCCLSVCEYLKTSFGRQDGESKYKRKKMYTRGKNTRENVWLSHHHHHHWCVVWLSCRRMKYRECVLSAWRCRMLCECEKRELYTISFDDDDNDRATYTYNNHQTRQQSKALTHEIVCKLNFASSSHILTQSKSTTSKRLFKETWFESEWRREID